MWLMFAAAAGLAGELVVEAHQPAQVHVGGQPVAELYTASVLHLQLVPGKYDVTVMVNGKPESLDVEIAAEGATTLVIGRSGITTGQAPAVAEAVFDGPAKVEIRVSGGAGVMVHIGDTRHRVGAGEVLVVEVPQGDHKMQIRDPAGTIVWARGTLQIDGSELVVQVSEGRMPEVAGTGGTYRPDR